MVVVLAFRQSKQLSFKMSLVHDYSFEVLTRDGKKFGEDRHAVKHCCHKSSPFCRPEREVFDTIELGLEGPPQWAYEAPELFKSTVFEKFLEHGSFCADGETPFLLIFL